MVLTKMRGNPDLVIAKNLYCLAAFSILISFFAGCTAGSCLSYGHSCWGAHGKRSMDTRPSENFGVAERKMSVPTTFDGRWLLSRLVNRQMMQAPLAAKLRARLLDVRSLHPPSVIDDESDVLPNTVGIKHSSNVIDKISGDVDVRDVPKIEQKLRMTDSESSDVLFPQRKDFINDDDQAIKMGLYKILKNLDERVD